jgi:hypothetical protein
MTTELLTYFVCIMLGISIGILLMGILHIIDRDKDGKRSSR